MALIVIFFAYQIFMNSRVLEKSIFEPLDKNTVAAITEKDPTFATFYQQCSIIRETVEANEDVKKYRNITYKQLQEYMNHYGNKMWCDEQAKKAIQEYEQNVHSKILQNEKNIIDKWQKYLDEHDPSKFITIDVKYSYQNSDWGPVPIWYYIVKYPKGNLSECDAVVTITRKDDNEDTNEYFYSEPQMNVTLPDLLTHNTPDDACMANSYDSNYWNYYKVAVSVNSITLAHGTKISTSDIETVPAEMRAYLDDKSEENEVKMIKALIQPNYPSKEEYALQKIKEALKDLNANCYELIEKVSQYNSIFQCAYTPTATVSTSVATENQQ